MAVVGMPMPKSTQMQAVSISKIITLSWPSSTRTRVRPKLRPVASTIPRMIPATAPMMMMSTDITPVLTKQLKRFLKPSRWPR